MTRPPVEVSFEFFPPKDEAAAKQLWSAIERLAPIGPRFVSVTYGAGGSTRARTHAAVERILEETSLTPAAHLTCIGASRAEIDDIARRYHALGVRHLVALRGDLPTDSDAYAIHPDGYANAAELVEGLKRVADFDINVAAYPETHREAASPKDDLDHLKRKLDAGASRAITQFFCTPETFLRFVDRARAAGIDAEIVPGILPITNFERAVEFAARCGASVPAWLAELFHGLDADPEQRQLVAAATACDLCEKLAAEGVDRFHFYTLNRPQLTAAICRRLGLKPMQEAA